MYIDFFLSTIFRVIVYYLRAKSKSRIAMVKLLQEMLYYESQDKEFLLSNISKVTQGKEWMFDSEPPSIGCDRDFYTESSSTWRFSKNSGAGGDQDNFTFKKQSSYADLGNYPSTSGKFCKYLSYSISCLMSRYFFRIKSK